ncbi:transporter [Paraburkholderia sp. IMGN_8]|uniref:SphA family protein n=1 Tax=Paraburkholderia sp. IMGN_8 TaxID=3136564 RepID=UPI003100B143
MRTKIIIGGMALAAGLSPVAAWSSEGNIFGGPVGGTDIRNAMLPTTSGFYGALVGAYSFANHLYGDNWAQNSKAKVDAHVWGGAATLMYVYPFKLWGGTLASSIQGQVTYGHMSAFGKSQYFEGTGDIYSELISYSKYIGPLWGERPANGLPYLPYGLTVKAAYSMIFPTGKYNTTDLQTTGHNDYFYIPNFAVTYLTGPNGLGDGLEFSAHVFLDFSSRNNKTKYSSGPVNDVDIAVSERVGRWQAGVAGCYATQLSDDTINGIQAPPNGKRLASVALGPVLAYDIPDWKASVKIKVQLPVAQRNALNLTKVIVSFSKAL